MQCYILGHPLAFFRRVLKAFSANQGMLLAGAVAYYSLLSIIPLLILAVLGASYFVDQAALLATIGHYLEWLVPSQSKAVLADVGAFLDNSALGVVMLCTLAFFSSLAFSVLEKAMHIIFAHRHAETRRHFAVSVLLPYALVGLLALGLLALTAASVAVGAMCQSAIQVADVTVHMESAGRYLGYLLGFGMETFVLTLIYLVIPVGKTQLRHALIGGVTAAALWEVLRHLMVWYFATLSQASVVYGSLTTAVVALFSMEIAAMLVLLGAQVIAEYEKLSAEDVCANT